MQLFASQRMSGSTEEQRVGESIAERDEQSFSSLMLLRGLTKCLAGGQQRGNNTALSILHSSAAAGPRLSNKGRLINYFSEIKRIFISPSAFLKSPSSHVLTSKLIAFI